jgi:hypothetical protein
MARENPRRTSADAPATVLAWTEEGERAWIVDMRAPHVLERMMRSM